MSRNLVLVSIRLCSGCHGPLGAQVTPVVGLVSPMAIQTLVASEGEVGRIFHCPLHMFVGVQGVSHRLQWNGTFLSNPQTPIVLRVSGLEFSVPEWRVALSDAAPGVTARIWGLSAKVHNLVNPIYEMLELSVSADFGSCRGDLTSFDCQSPAPYCDNFVRTACCCCCSVYCFLSLCLSLLCRCHCMCIT